MLLKKVYHLSKFFILVALSMVAFFVFYSRSLGLEFSLVTSGFILLLTANFILLLQLFRHKVFQIVIFLTLIAFIVYSYVCYAYYQFFGTFLQITSGQANNINKSFLSLLSDFVFMVPRSLLISGIILVIGIISLTVLYARNRYRINYELDRWIEGVNFLAPVTKRYHIPRSTYLLLLILLNAAFHFGLGQRVVSKSNLSKEQYLSLLGPAGFLYYSAAHNITHRLESIAQKELGTSTAMVNFDIEKMNVDFLRDAYKEIKTLNEEQCSTTSLPIINGKPHIIIYQMESVDSWPLQQDPSPMPFLKEAQQKYQTVGHFFSNSCITVNAEFAAMCSFYPESSGPISDLYSDNNFYCLPQILKEDFGYSTSVHHSNASSFWGREKLDPKWGIDNLYFTPHYANRLDDQKVVTDVVNRIKTSDQPTFSYLIGFTSHTPHNDKYIEFHQTNNSLDITPYPYELNSNTRSMRIDEPTARNYFGFMGAVDQALESLFQQLEMNGLDQNTIVMVFGDHRIYEAWPNEEKKVANFYNHNEIPLLIYVPGLGPMKLKDFASQIDIAPTLLHILNGYERPYSKYFLGKSLFSCKHNNTAVSKCLGESFLANNQAIIRYDNLTKSHQTIYSQPGREGDIQSYTDLLDTTVGLSDSILKDNEIIKINEEPEKTEVAMVKGIYIDKSTDWDLDGLSNLREEVLTTDPRNADTDKDGYPDGEEFINGYNPLGAGKAEDMARATSTDRSK